MNTMDELCLEYGYTSLNHVGEELCGDKVEYCKNGDYVTLVLSDGLGSGVKANILATLTSKILCTMISNGIGMEDCLETILQSLPVCKVRGIAYSTFSVININNQGKGYLIEFDNPQVIYYHNGRCQDFAREKLEILGKTVFKTDLNLAQDDVIVIMSDGAVHAGIGMTLNFGWKRNDIMNFIDRAVNSHMSARCIASLVASACNDLYLGQPGDDTTVAAVRVRKELKVKIMVGPPIEKDKDDYYIEEFLKGEGKKVVCGGTSSLIVAKHLNTEVKTALDFSDIDVPPIGYIKGIDLATEGVLTLRKLLFLCEKYISNSDLSPKYFERTDGASRLADILFEEATHITFYVGQSINAAHRGLPIDTTMKLKLVETLSENLKAMGKYVEVNYD